MNDVANLGNLSLIDAYVLPIMNYALEAISLTRVQHYELHISWNNLFRHK